MSEYIFAPDEAVLIKTKGVYKKNNDEGLRAKFANEVCGELILTNKSIVFRWETGAFRKIINTEVSSLANLKIYNGMAQVKPGAPSTFGSPVPLEFYFNDRLLCFLFPASQKKAIKNWVETINEVLTGVRGGFDSSDVGSIDVGKAAVEIFEPARQIAEDVVDIAKPLLPIAAAVANAKGGVMGGIAGTVFEVIGSLSDGQGDLKDAAGLDCPNDLPETSESEAVNTDAASENAFLVAAIDQQIEALQKLKSLVDAGILTEEEFAQKKKQLMGL